MRFQLDESGTLNGFQKVIDAVNACEDVRALGVLACDNNALLPQEMSNTVCRVKKPLFGGLFPALIHGNRKIEKGTLVIGFPFEVQVNAIDGLSDPHQDFDTLMEDLLPGMDDCPTLCVLVDGFSKRIGDFIEGLFNTFGLEINYIGGGAGSLSMKSKPCLFTNQGVSQDSAIIAGLSTHSGIGVSHGWKSIQGPFKVTEADRNRVISLEWEPAFDVYQQIVSAHSGRSLDSDNFYDLASAYPFGITKMMAERIVRDPVLTDEQGALVCVGEVPEGSFLDILNGDETSLIDAAGAASRQAREDFGPMEYAGFTFLVDCISRALFLSDRFSEALEVVYDAQWPMVGMCSIGEIANSGQDYLEFYNKTCVVGIIADK